MKLFKKPVFAVILCVVLILCSTLLSVHIRFGAKCDRVKDALYTGVETNGYTQKGIASHLQNIGAYAAGLVTIAKNYDIDTADVEQAENYLQMSLNYSRDYASHIHYNYAELNKALDTMIDQLQRTELSERDADGVRQYVESLNGARSAIEESAYNEQVREFLRKYDRFPTDSLASLAGVSMPEFFA